MSRYRTIKPEFWTSAQIVECSTNARLLFIGLWNFCDDFGRHIFSAKQIKAEIFPADDFSSESILGMLNELSKNGLIIVYEAENKEILQVTGWHHQRIDKPQKARFPGLNEEHSKNDTRTFSLEGNRIEKKGRERETRACARESSPSARPPPPKNLKIQISENQEPTARQELDANNRGLAVAGIPVEWAKFRDYHRAKASLLSDWDAAWRRWLDKREAFAGNGQAKAKPPPSTPGQDRLRTSSGLWVGSKFYPD